jgi:hypothetical protein
MRIEYRVSERGYLLALMSIGNIWEHGGSLFENPHVEAEGRCILIQHDWPLLHRATSEASNG